MSPFLGELMGTMMLVILGDGVVACVLLNKSKGQNSGWIVITAGWAFGVLVGVYTAQAFGSPEAHINPAVTVALAVRSGSFSKYAGFIPAQLIGGFIGGVIVWLAYLPHWEETESQLFKLLTFCTAPAIRRYPANVLVEIIGTAVLIVGVGVIFFSKATGAGATPGFGAFMVAAVVWGIGLSLGGPTGYAINPARDLGPRIAHAVLPIAGKGDSDWAYSWVPVFGPLIGGLLGGLLIQGM